MTFRFVIALCSLAAAGCSVQTTVPADGSAASTVAASPDSDLTRARSSLPPAVVAEGQTATPAPAPSSSATEGQLAATAESQSAAVSASSPVAAVENLAPAASSAVASPSETSAAASVAAQSPVVAAPSAPPVRVVPPPPVDTLDFTSLGARLRTTKCIGVLTKLSVKNQADDLLAQFRDYHKQQDASTLPDLRRSYDTLVVKLLSLVREGDPPLAIDIDRSRAAIWDILSDQRKFIDANLMAGASL